MVNPKPKSRSNPPSKSNAVAPKATETPKDTTIPQKKVTYRSKSKKPRAPDPAGEGGNTTLTQQSQNSFKTVVDTPYSEILDANEAVGVSSKIESDLSTIHSSFTPQGVFGNPKFLMGLGSYPHDPGKASRYSIMSVPSRALNHFLPHCQGYTHFDGKLVITFTWAQDPLQYGEQWFFFVPGGSANYAFQTTSSAMKVSMLPHVKVDFASGGTATLEITRPPGHPLFNMVEDHHPWGTLFLQAFPGTFGKRDGANIITNIAVRAHFEDVKLYNPSPIVIHTLSEVPISARGMAKIDGVMQFYALSRHMKDVNDIEDRIHTPAESQYLTQYYEAGDQLPSDCIVLAPSETTNPPVVGQPFMGRCIVRVGNRQYAPEDPEFAGIIAAIHSYNEDPPAVDEVTPVNPHMDGDFFRDLDQAGRAFNTIAEAGATAYSLYNMGRAALTGEEYENESQNFEAPSIDPSLVSSHTVSVQSRSTEQDVDIKTYQGPQMDYFSGQITKAPPKNKLADIFAREHLAFFRAADLSSQNYSGFDNLSVDESNGTACLKILNFPADMGAGDRANMPGGVVKDPDGNPIPKAGSHKYMSPWAAYKSNFAESRCKIRLRLKFNKTKFHQFTVRILYTPTGALATTGMGVADTEPSRVEIKEYTLSDSNEIVWDQPPAFSHNGWDGHFQVAISVFNASVNMSVSPIIFMQGFLSYHDCEVSSFQGMEVVPYYAQRHYTLVPTRHISDKVLVAKGRVHALCSDYWFDKVMRWVTLSRSPILTAVECYEGYDREKFKNLRLAYDATPNYYDLITTMIDNCTTPDAPAVGELLIKWTTVIGMLKEKNLKLANKLIEHFMPAMTEKLVDVTCRQKDLVEYITRLIPVSQVKFHIPDTVEAQCAPLARAIVTKRSYTNESRAESFTPSRLTSTYHHVDYSDYLTMSWVDFFAPMFYANFGSWHVRYMPSPIQVTQSDAAPPQIVGSVTRSVDGYRAYTENVEALRHITSGDSLVVTGTPLYLHVPPHSQRPTIHHLPVNFFHEEWRHTRPGGTDSLYYPSRPRGQPLSPAPSAIFSFAGHIVDYEGDVHVKPGKDFAFCHYLGYADFITNKMFKEILEGLGPNTTIPYPSLENDAYFEQRAFSP